ncbi:MAG: hypothetical protein ACI4VQ_01785 [Clostridia bacterium]
MVKIEVLFPEVCNLFGNMYNIKYLEKSIKDVEIINTALTDEPSFISEDVDMIYMAPMTEKTQEIVINKLKPYVEKIKELIEKNKVFLVIGNALEVFGKYIENEDGSKIEGLGITNLYAKRDMMNRYNYLFLGKIEDTKIVGFKSQFSMSYGDNSNQYVFEAIRGTGINKESTLEGIRINNFIGTYVLGPILVLNPLFTKYILKLMGIENQELAFEKEAMECYNIRLKEFENPNTKYD